MSFKKNKKFLMHLIFISFLFISQNKVFSNTWNDIEDTLEDYSLPSFEMNLTTFGNYAQFFPVLAGYGMTFYHSDREGSSQLTKAVLFNLAATSLLKLTIHERRPNKSNKQSFPSGHTSGAFVGSGFVHFRYGFSSAALLYVTSAVVGYSRVRARAHYWHDVIAGAALGLSTSYLFTTKFIKNKKITPKVSYSPSHKSLFLGLDVEL